MWTLEDPFTSSIHLFLFSGPMSCTLYMIAELTCSNRHSYKASYKVSDLTIITSGVGFWRELEYQWKLDSRSTTPSSFDIKATSWFNTFASTSTRSNKDIKFLLHRCGAQEWYLIILQLHLAGVELGKVSWDEPVLITKFVDSLLANVYKPT